MNNNNTLGYRLNTLRKERNLTVTELAKLAGVTQPVISNLQNGREVIGERVARRIAHALQLDGKDQEEFVYLAINDCTCKVLNGFKGYPAEVLNLIAGELDALGIIPSAITKCIRKSEADTALYLNSGKRVLINLDIAIK